MKKNNYTEKKVFINNFAGFDMNTEPKLLKNEIASLAYNINSTDGSLKAGIGITKARLLNATYDESPETPRFVEINTENMGFKQCWHYNFYDASGARKNKLIVITNTRKMFEYEIPTINGKRVTNTADYILQDFPIEVINYEMKVNDSIHHVLLLLFENHKMLIFNSAMTGVNKLSIINSSPIMHSLCVAYNKLFAICKEEPNKVMFSSALSPLHWSEDLSGAGKINVIDDNAPVKKLISLNGFVYAFKEYVIYKITSNSDHTEFDAKKVVNLSSKIYTKTICIAENKIIFLSEDGLFEFDGNSVKKIDLKCEKKFLPERNKNVVATYASGKYYLAASIEFDDTVEHEVISPPKANNVLIELDVSTKKVNMLRGFNCTYITSVNEADYSMPICILETSYGYALAEINQEKMSFGSPIQKKWKSKDFDFEEPNKQKTLKELKISLSKKSDMTEDFIITIKNEKGDFKQFNLVNSEAGDYSFKFSLAGKRFSICFDVLTLDFCIDSLELVANLVSS